jgi:hypothetical protein
MHAWFSCEPTFIEKSGREDTNDIATFCLALFSRDSSKKLLYSLKKQGCYRHGEKALVFTYMVMKARKGWSCFYAGLWPLSFGTQKQSKEGWSLFAYIHDVSSISL